MEQDVSGRVGKPTGLSSPTEPQSSQGLGPSGFDPSRGATLTVGDDAYSPFWRHAIVSQILDIQERENAAREEFTPAIDRKMAERAINWLFDIYDCRSSDFAACYAWEGLWNALRVDWRKLTFLPSDSDGSPEGGDRNGLRAQHDSAGLEEASPNLQHNPLEDQ